jgi:NAD-dependent DNA ligase
MPSEKVAKILKSKSNFTDEEISNMTDHEAWRWVYQNKRSVPTADKRDQICFTGFRPNEREKLWEIANDVGMMVVKSVTKKLTFLCVGENPGPSKLEKSRVQNVVIMNEQQFLNMLQTGEIPNAH